MSKEAYNPQGGVEYISPFQGILSNSSKTPRDGYELVEYTDAKGGARSKYIRRYNSISGIISALTFKQNKLPDGKVLSSWEVHLTDGSEKMILSLADGSNGANMFLKAIPNINKDVPVSFSSFKEKDGDKAILVIRQSETIVRSAFTKENPNGLPQPKKLSNGKWEWSEQSEFLYKIAMDFAGTIQPVTQSASTGNAQADTVSNEYLDPTNPF